MNFDLFRWNKNWWNDDTDMDIHPILGCYTKEQILEQNPEASKYFKLLNNHVITCDSQVSEMYKSCNPSNDIYYAIQKCYINMICKDLDQAMKIVESVDCDYIITDRHSKKTYSEIFKNFNRIPVTTILEKSPEDHYFSIYSEPTNIPRDHDFADICFEIEDHFLYGEVELTLIAKDFSKPKDFEVDQFPKESLKGIPFTFSEDCNITENMWKSVIEALGKE